MTHLQTKSLTLIPQTVAEVQVQIKEMSPEQRTQLSPDWLARVHTATAVDQWTLGFTVKHRVTGAVIGQCGFKGPPDADGTVEIAYMIEPEHQGKGYATEAAGALVAFAFNSGQVRVVRAHTLPESNASTRVLTKSGFHHIGEVTDPEDGLVWRWEKQLESTYPDQSQRPPGSQS